MPHAHTELYYHLVWATKDRQPLITPDLEPHLFQFIRHKCAELEVPVHALNGIPDHVHLACSVPAKLAVADFVERIKGASSHFLKDLGDELEPFYWQPGYSAFTLARRDLPRVVAYIQNQKQHHADGTLTQSLERTESP